MAGLREVQGANKCRVRAYRNAARSIDNLGRSVAEMAERGEDLSAIPGIGKELARKAVEISATGSLADLTRLRRQVPRAVTELMDLPGLGPNKARQLHEALGVATRSELAEAAQAGRIRRVPGFGPKTEERILAELAARRSDKGSNRSRFRHADVEQVVEGLLAHVRRDRGVVRAEAAGSFRRGKETVGDIDMVAACRPGYSVIDHFVSFGGISRVVSKGPTRATVVMRSGLQVDLRSVDKDSWGAALHYFTGSRAHTLKIRLMAQRAGLKVNEYGVYDGDRKIAGETEEDVNAALGLPYIEPELREDRGEVEAGLDGRLPELVTEGDIRGNLHTHTVATDGRMTLRQVADGAMARGYEYIAVTDHTQSLRITNGQDPARVLAQFAEIDRLNDELEGRLRVLKSAEVDILLDGSLDLPDGVLREMDVVVCSVHSHFKLPRKHQTERIIRAISKPCPIILGHGTGRKINVREPYDVDIEAVIDAAARLGRVLEVNGQPERLDINDVYAKMAKEAGVKLSVSTDAHRLSEFDFMRHGVMQARRGWLEARDVINTLPLEEMLASFG